MLELRSAFEESEQSRNSILILKKGIEERLNQLSAEHNGLLEKFKQEVSLFKEQEVGQLNHLKRVI